MRFSTIAVLVAATAALVAAGFVVGASDESRRAPDGPGAPLDLPAPGAERRMEPSPPVVVEERGVEDEIRALRAANERLRGELASSRRRIDGLAADLAEVRRVAADAASDAATASRGVRVASDRVVGQWEHSVDGRPGGRLEFAADGAIRDAAGAECGRWRLAGASLVLRWPNPGAPGGGEWIDSCVLVEDGSYVGTNQRGSVIRGTLRRDE